MIRYYRYKVLERERESEKNAILIISSVTLKIKDDLIYYMKEIN